jgi:WD40 repeat protein
VTLATSIHNYLPREPRDERGFSVVAPSPDGRLLAAGGTAREVHVIDLADPTKTRKLPWESPGERVQINALAFTPDGRHLAAGSTSAPGDPVKSVFVVWDLATEQATPSQNPGSTIQSIVPLADGRQGFAVGVSKVVIGLAEPPDFGLSPWIKTSGFEDGWHSLAFLAGGKRLLATEALQDGQTRSGSLRLFDLSGREPRRIEPTKKNDHPLGNGAVSPSGDLVAAGRADGSIELWGLPP